MELSWGNRGECGVSTLPIKGHCPRHGGVVGSVSKCNSSSSVPFPPHFTSSHQNAPFT